MNQERIQRFQVGDQVSVVRGGTTPSTGRVFKVERPPFADFGGGSGRSAKYWVVGQEGPLWDWQLERAGEPAEESHFSHVCRVVAEKLLGEVLT